MLRDPSGAKLRWLWGAAGSGKALVAALVVTQVLLGLVVVVLAWLLLR